MSNSDDKDKIELAIDETEPTDTMLLPNPVLQPPPQSDNPITSLSGALFTDDSFAVVSSKLSAHEGLLRILTEDLRYSDFMREVLLTVLKVVRSEAGTIFEFDRENKILFFRAVVGQSSDQLASFTIPIGQGVVGHVAESRQPLVVDNLRENKIHLRSIQEAVGFDARNLIAIPILVRGKIFGVLELLNRVGEASYTAADVELLTYICEIVGKVIEIRLTLSWALRKKEGVKAA